MADRRREILQRQELIRALREEIADAKHAMRVRQMDAMIASLRQELDHMTGIATSDDRVPDDDREDEFAASEPAERWNGED